MNLEIQRADAKKLCVDSAINVLPYGNAWWLLGHGINQVVGELAGLTLSDLTRFRVTQR